MARIGDELPAAFSCDGATLIGVLHVPPAPASVGVIIVVGGAQYRVGSHRQFVLMARDLAARGFAVLRFDCRGMGDSDGDFPGFENIVPEIDAAAGFLMANVPSVSRLALWGLCDATSAICTYARNHLDVVGVVLVNPWVYTPAARARARLKHYYLKRLTERDWLRKFMRGEFDLWKSARALLANLVRGLGLSKQPGSSTSEDPTLNPLADAMLANLQDFQGRVLVILSGQDITAQEFDGAVQDSKEWRQKLAEPRVTLHRLIDADHTFSSHAWRDQVAEWTSAWLQT